MTLNLAESNKIMNGKVKTLEDYNKFSHEVKHQNRTFLSSESIAFLNWLELEIEKKVIVEKKGSHFFRTRKCEKAKIAIDKQGMKPSLNLGSEGRANAFNINMLYLADKKDIAISESRAGLQEHITVATFELTRDLRIINLADEGMDWGVFLGFFSCFPEISFQFSKPLSIDEARKEYIPTQVLAEFFKSKGYDGVVYRSQFSVDGEEDYHKNYALFSLDAAEAIGHEICCIKKISIEVGTISSYEPY